MQNRKEDQIFKKPVEVAFRDCDNLNRVKLSTLMSYVADIGGEDYTAKGFSHDALWENGFVFLLSRMTIRIHEYFHSYEPILVETFERGVKGPLFHRDFEMLRKTGEIAVSAHSAWILCEPQTRRILRPSECPTSVPDNFAMQIQCGEPGKIRMPEGLNFARTKQVRFTDLDCNGHVYNAVYADIAFNSLPFEVTQRPLTEFSINFINEAKFGDQLEIYTKLEGNTAFVQATGQKGASFHCLFTFC